MSLLLQIENPNQFSELSRLPGLQLVESQILKQHAPDAHWVLIQNDSIAAHCSLWWQNTPSYPNQKTGLIGHYAAQDVESAQQLLAHACERLAAQGCTMAIAPIDGNTWRRYRLLSDRGSEPIFFLELDNPDKWCEHFEQVGFTALAEYSSALNTDLSQQDTRMERVAERLATVQIRSVNLDQFEAELQAIYDLSLTGFRHNFLYTPIDRAEFIHQYSQVKPYIQPQLVLMAEQAGKLVGFLFAVPDLLQAKRGEAINTIIIKTVAVLPGRAYAGLGNLLVAKVQAIAHQSGYTRAIHALMHDANNSRNLSDRYAQTIRQYTLFSRLIQPLL